MQRKVKKYLWDVRKACESIARFLAGKTFDDYQAEEVLRLAVERVLSIIGEAVTQALKVDPSLDTKLTDARKIVGFRNQLNHGYHLVDHQEVWNILVSHVPILLTEVQSLVPESEDPQPIDQDE